MSLSTTYLLQVYAEIAARLLPQEMRPDRCVNATRVTIEALRVLGLMATPLSVVAQVFNSAAVAGKSNADGGYAIATETCPAAADENGWAGHLVAIVGNKWLVDAAAGQFARPERGIDVAEVIVAPITRRFLRGRDPCGFKNTKGAALTYTARLDDHSYRGLSGFQRHEANLDCAWRIVGAVRETLTVVDSELVGA